MQVIYRDLRIQQILKNPESILLFVIVWGPTIIPTSGPPPAVEPLSAFSPLQGTFFSALYCWNCKQEEARRAQEEEERLRASQKVLSTPVPSPKKTDGLLVCICCDVWYLLGCFIIFAVCVFVFLLNCYV